MIDAGNGSEGFFFNGSGLQWNETYNGFGGWLGQYYASNPGRKIKLMRTI